MATAAAADAKAAAPPPPPPLPKEDLRHLAAPMSELAAVQMEVAAAESRCRKCVRLLVFAWCSTRTGPAAVDADARLRPPPKEPKKRLQSLLRAGEREMAKLQATIDNARAAVSKEASGGGGGRASSNNSTTTPHKTSEPLGAEDDDGGAAATAAAAEAARRATQGIWKEVAEMDARIAVVLHALGEVERLRKEV